ncbi:MAG TPA: hypothetical protein V6C65_08590 [Allocoleopsis sp.]
MIYEIEVSIPEDSIVTLIDELEILKKIIGDGLFEEMALGTLRRCLEASLGQIQEIKHQQTIEAESEEF